MTRASPNGALCAFTLAAFSILIFAQVALSATATPTKGRIPNSAIEGGRIDLAAVPDYIPALDQQGYAIGYVSKWLAIGDDKSDYLDPIPVFGDDLKTLVGHMITDVGFVPLRDSSDAYPTFRTVVAPGQEGG